MIDLHCHILPGIDDGAADLDTSLAMARALIADGVSIVACTPHILPGLYHNTGPQIRSAIAMLQGVLDDAGLALYLVSGADNHMAPDFADGLKRGHLLTLANSRYVLVEPPHHVAPMRIEEFFRGLQSAGYVPVLTHPERLSWINSNYPLIQRLARSGVWMQLTAGSLVGTFGSKVRYWAERMLSEGCVHILASDAHDTVRRPPNLHDGLECAARLIGEAEARHLVVTRPKGILDNAPVHALPMPEVALAS
jgi:protein-tyrosine phosphatase